MRLMRKVTSRSGERGGFTRIELAALIVLITVLVSVGFIGIRALHRYGDGARFLKEGTRAREIHQSLIIYGRDHEAGFARPGLLSLDGLLQPIDERIGDNTTANVMSMLVMQKYFPTSVLVSPREQSPNVDEYDDYDFNAYAPADGMHWDTGLRADLSKQSHVSFAHLPLFGERMETQWRETFDSRYAVLGWRGPADGIVNSKSYTCFDGEWVGNIVYNDNHVVVENTMTPNERRPGVTDGDEPLDNIFAMEDGPAGGDCVLAFTKSMSEGGPVLQYD